MRCISIAFALSMVGSASFAAQPVVTENLTGIIGGSKTVDTEGYFSTAGADLAGMRIAIYLQYVPKLLGASEECRTHDCTYNTSDNLPDTPGSLVVTITINGHRMVYSPSQEAAVFFNTKAPYQLTVDSDAYSGFGIGLPGLQLATEFGNAPIFGQPLSPGNSPVMKISSSNYMFFYTASSQNPVEELTYKPAGGSK